MGLGLRPQTRCAFEGVRRARVGQRTMSLHEREPHIHIEDGHGGRVSINVTHYGRVPDLTREFSSDVVRQAVNKWRRSSREHRILNAARGLSWTAYRLVEAHLIRERCLAVEYKLERKAERASWSRPSADAQQPDERDVRRVERAELDAQQRERTPIRVPTKDEAERANDQSWLDALLSHIERPDVPERTETLTERAQRELAETKARKPKDGRSERRAMTRALAEREESLRDLVEVTPQRDTAIDRAMRDTQAERAQPQRERDRSR